MTHSKIPLRKPLQAARIMARSWMKGPAIKRRAYQEKWKIEESRQSLAQTRELKEKRDNDRRTGRRISDRQVRATIEELDFERTRATATPSAKAQITREKEDRQVKKSLLQQSITQAFRESGIRTSARWGLVQNQMKRIMKLDLRDGRGHKVPPAKILKDFLYEIAIQLQSPAARKKSTRREKLQGYIHQPPIRTQAGSFVRLIGRARARIFIARAQSWAKQLSAEHARAFDKHHSTVMKIWEKTPHA